MLRATEIIQGPRVCWWALAIRRGTFATQCQVRSCHLDLRCCCAGSIRVSDTRQGRAGEAGHADDEGCAEQLLCMAHLLQSLLDGRIHLPFLLLFLLLVLVLRVLLAGRRWTRVCRPKHRTRSLFQRSTHPVCRPSVVEFHANEHAQHMQPGVTRSTTSNMDTNGCSSSDNNSGGNNNTRKTHRHQHQHQQQQQQQQQQQM